MTHRMTRPLEIFSVDGLSVDHNDDGGVVVQWNQPKNIGTNATAMKQGRVILSYYFRLFQREAGTSDWKCIMDEKSAKKWLISSGLKARTKYEFYVESYSLPAVLPGSGPNSAVVSIETKEGSPDTPPRNLRDTTCTFDEITVEWNPPATSAGDVLGYKLYFDTADVDGFSEVDVASDVRPTYTASRLESGTTYRFQVLAYSRVGEGPLSDIIECSTLESAESRRNRLKSGNASKSRLHSTQRRSSIRGDVEEQEPAESVEAQSHEADDWKTMRHTGDHKKARAVRNDWVARDSKNVAKTVTMPIPKALHETRPSGNARAPDERVNLSGGRNKVRLEGVDRKKFLSFRDMTSAEKDGNIELKTKAKANRQALEQKFLAKLSMGPEEDVSEPDNDVEEKETALQEEARILPGPKLNYPKPAPIEPTPVPVLPRRTSKRVITEAESQGIAAPVPILGSIKSMTGTIRGKKNGVRAKLEVITGRTLLNDKTSLQLMFDEEHKKKSLVLYTSTNAVIRNSFERCNSVLKLFDLLRLKVERRDLYLDSKFASELTERAPELEVPVVFASGVLLGDATKVMQLNETGELKKILRGYVEAPSGQCNVCGGAGYITCTWCQGSTKSIQTSFESKEKNLALRCSLCNENGLQRCPAC